MLTFSDVRLTDLTVKAVKLYFLKIQIVIVYCCSQLIISIYNLSSLIPPYVSFFGLVNSRQSKNGINSSESFLGVERDLLSWSEEVIFFSPSLFTYSIVKKKCERLL